MSFDDLGLMPELLRAVREQEYETPTAVQSQAIPAVLAGRDLIAAAQTGSGKTAGFTLPLLQRLMAQRLMAQNSADADQPTKNVRRNVRALVLVPTRELCAQVNDSVRTYGKHLPLRSTQIFGGVGMQPQVDALRRGVDIVIATPGRLLDHVEQRTIDLRQIEILVLDEADRMLDMGFIIPIRRILSLLPKQRQNLLFSATFADEIRGLADQLMNSPEMIQVTPRNRPVETIAQELFQVAQSQKPDLLVHLFTHRAWEQVLVFTRTKHGANRLTEKLLKAGITADAIHGNKSQTARTRALANFKAQKVRALVATEIAARGLDIDGLPQVVNYDVPQVIEDYVHRIGRTGRAGAEGCAVSLVCKDEHAQWRAIERLIKRNIAPTPLPEFEALPSNQERSSGQERERTESTERRRNAPSGQRSSQARSGRSSERRGDANGRPPRGNAQERQRDRPAPGPMTSAQPSGARGEGRFANDRDQARPRFNGEPARPRSSANDRSRNGSGGRTGAPSDRPRGEMRSEVREVNGNRSAADTRFPRAHGRANDARTDRPVDRGRPGSQAPAGIFEPERKRYFNGRPMESGRGRVVRPQRSR